MTCDHRLGPLKKGELQYNYPTGPTLSDDPQKRNVPDSALLNRHEWYEVLYFVNKFANLNAKAGQEVRVAKKAEQLIHTKLPAHLRSHAHVTDWLINNWSAA